MTGPDPLLLSLNTATVRAQWTMDQIVEGCVRHGIRGISPWRDQVAKAGLIATAQRVREHGLVVTGYCRGGMFPAIDAAGRRAARTFATVHAGRTGRHGIFPRHGAVHAAGRRLAAGDLPPMLAGAGTGDNRWPGGSAG